MRNNVLCLAMLFFLIIAPFSSAQALPGGLDEGFERIDEIKRNVDDLSDADRWREKWEFLGSRWKETLLRNPAISFFDSLFTQLSFVFLVIFGVPYSLSLMLLAVMTLWVLVFIFAADLIKGWGVIGEGVWPYVGGIVVAIALALAKVYENLIILVTRLVLSPEYWLTRVFMFMVVFLCFMAFVFVKVLLMRFMIRRKAVLGKKKLEIAQGKIIKFADALFGKAQPA
jgi:hypothetical protein